MMGRYFDRSGSSRWLVFAIAVVAVPNVTGCATMNNGYSQAVTIGSTPDQADIIMDGMLVGKTPWAGPMKRGKERVVSLKKDGYAPQQITLTSDISGWVFGNVLFSFIGLFTTTYEVNEGTAYSYSPDAYHVILRPIQPDTAKDQQTRSDGRMKRFVLMFYPDIAREAVNGYGEKLAALMELMECTEAAACVPLCRRELAESQGPDAFAERLIRIRQGDLASVSLSAP